MIIFSNNYVEWIWFALPIYSMEGEIAGHSARGWVDSSALG